jgi:hypothetical protein
MIWNAVGAVTSGLTLGTALMVFVEARRIRHVEWLSRTVQMWQGFNQLLLDDSTAARWRDFLDGKIPEAKIVPRDHYVLFSYINVIYLESRISSSRLLDRKYAQESLGDNVRQLAPMRNYIVPLLRSTGYDDRFVELIERAAAGFNPGGTATAGDTSTI